ncbi:MAG: hypothetical protein M3Z31_04635 [Pseudomonadota bacterium]|nr:hypothetical protein [Pseudomonadota bacterium]
MEPPLWPPLSVACALLPLIRREVTGDSRAPATGNSVAVDVCAIVENGMFGYELAPHVSGVPFLILGCAEDNIPRLRRTTFDPKGVAGLRLATVRGREVNAARPHVRRPPRQDETLCADWSTAARAAWDHLAPALAHSGPQWEAAMQACRSLENALTIAGLRLAEWDPAVEFCGLSQQASYGLPLRSAHGGTGTLTLKSADLWLLNWKIGQTVIRHEFSAFSVTALGQDGRARDARR